MKKIMTLAAVTMCAASLMSGTAGAADLRPAQPNPWDKRVKCQSDDPDGRHIVTRYGNSKLGWHHFTGRHNIKK
ncbi:hypothetical protein J7F01_41150 [Streptomyces sp. ISL-22]|uniref:hypothetical protein n=1 Tax=unclassified Streptomyces TaxID=2593676 RepID=UPI001BEA5601|nr:MULTISPECIES: hypothetical protein [unclassified Streptomyces]MBT2423459.1 hypothetical protein [Streptomyces sp. ISL-24]MBT2438398.1 hypothetical protein [Streptomyces sp. ISL-22]